MAIATTTAIAAAGLAVSAGTAGASFAQAAKQRKLQRQAQQSAEEAMQEARKRLDVNYYDQLAIQKEPYELQRQALISAGAQGIQAAQEAESRGAAAAAGRIQMAQQEGQQDIRTAMGQDMFNLEKLSAVEDSRLRDEQAKIDMAEAQGAQLAARDAAEAAAKATQAGFAGLQAVGQQAIQMAPLYDKTASSRIANQIDKTAMNKFDLTQGDVQKTIASLGKVNNIDFTKVASMTPMEYQDFMGKVDPNTLKLIQQKLPSMINSPIMPSQFAPKPNFYNPYAVPGIGG